MSLLQHVTTNQAHLTLLLCDRVLYPLAYGCLPVDGHMVYPSRQALRPSVMDETCEGGGRIYNGLPHTGWLIDLRY
jgi:hypothetical protein